MLQYMGLQRVGHKLANEVYDIRVKRLREAGGIKPGKKRSKEHPL